MQEDTISNVARTMATNEYTGFVMRVAGERAERAAEIYHFSVVHDRSPEEVQQAFYEAKIHHRNYIAAHKALRALAKVAVDMGLEHDILQDVPPPEAE